MNRMDGTMTGAESVPAAGAAAGTGHRAGAWGCRRKGALPLAENVDLERFAGAWFVIGGALTPFEFGAHDAIEDYEYRDGVMETTFRARRGGHDRPEFSFGSRAFVRPGTGNAVWGMQFLWPIRADYRIVRLADDYSFTVVGRKARDFVWVMARSPAFDEARWQAVVADLVDLGYRRWTLRRVPHRLPG